MIHDRGFRAEIQMRRKPRCSYVVGYCLQQLRIAARALVVPCLEANSTGDWQEVDPKYFGKTFIDIM